MSLTANVVWEIRTGGNDANGAGFDSSIGGGTDYSQQNSPQVTFDGATITASNGAAGATITISGYTVATTDKGNMFKIASGTNFTAGYYTITNVNTGSNTWTLDRNCTTGAGSACVGRMGGAALTFAIFSTSGPVITGNDVYIAGGTYTLTATTTILTNVGFRIIGYNATRGDQGRPLITTSTNSVNLFSIGNNGFPTSYFNLSLSNTAATRGKGFAMTNAFTSNCGPILLVNCKFDGLSIGIDGLGTNSNSTIWCYNCYFKSCTTNAISNSMGNLQLVSCLFNSNAGDAISCTNASTAAQRCHIINKCVFYNTTGAGYADVSNNSGSYRVFNNCTFHTNSTDGIKMNQSTNPQQLMVQNCIFVSNGGYGINFVSGTGIWYWGGVLDNNNAFYNNTSGKRNNFNTGALNEITITGDPCTNAASLDFSLNSTAGAGAALKSLSYPTTWVSGQADYEDVGAVRHVDPAAASKVLLVNGFQGGF